MLKSNTRPLVIFHFQCRGLKGQRRGVPPPAPLQRPKNKAVKRGGGQADAAQMQQISLTQPRDRPRARRLLLTDSSALTHNIYFWDTSLRPCTLSRSPTRKHKWLPRVEPSRPHETQLVLSATLRRPRNRERLRVEKDSNPCFHAVPSALIHN